VRSFQWKATVHGVSVTPVMRRSLLRMDEIVVPLSDLQVEHDPGTEWHPRADKANARLENGDLPDLNPRELAEHMLKPEVFVDIGTPRAAEDSEESAEGEV
jgi:hypothetical protein